MDDSEVLAALKRAQAGGAPKYHKKNAEQGKLFARERIARLTDANSFVEINFPSLYERARQMISALLTDTSAPPNERNVQQSFRPPPIRNVVMIRNSVAARSAYFFDHSIGRRGGLAFARIANAQIVYRDACAGGCERVDFRDPDVRGA